MLHGAEKSALTAEKPAGMNQPATSAPTFCEIDSLVAERIFGPKSCRAWNLTNPGSAGEPALIHGDWENPVVRHYACYPDIPEVSTTQSPFGGPAHYSSDIGAAWQVVEKLRDRGYRIVIASAERNQSGYTLTVTPTTLSEGGTEGRVTHTEATAPLAICLVALRASGVALGLRHAPVNDHR